VAKERVTAFTEYLKATGRINAAPAIEADAAAGEALRELVKSSRLATTFTTPRNLAMIWVFALAPLSNAIWMLIFGGIAAFLARHRSIRNGKGWAHGAHPVWAIWLLLGSLVLFVLVQWQAVESAALMIEVVRALSSGEAIAASSLYVAVAAVVPCVVLVLLAGLSLLWRVPLSVGITRGLRGVAVPVACALVLVYAVTVPFVARQEASLDYALRRTVKHEGRYLSELAGKRWPGSVGLNSYFRSDTTSRPE
jgi:hypothetical protein